MVIVGGRSLESLYMGRALLGLSRFANVLVVPVCSTPQTSTNSVYPGRPTDYLPNLLPTDVLHVCGAPAMVDAVRSIAASMGVVCYADPFLPTAGDTAKDGLLTRAKGWLAVPMSRKTGRSAVSRKPNRRESPRTAEATVRSDYRPESAFPMVDQVQDQIS